MNGMFGRRTVKTSWLPGIVASVLMLVMSFGENRSRNRRILQSVLVGATVAVVSYFAGREPKSQDQGR
jgi:VIT1/CCC1 family predicted Fe2+/Mn2+ transporter